jgi:D-alanyl-D-alanine carboxypeptidase
MTAALEQRITAIASSALTQQNVPGIAVAVSERGRVVFARGFGSRSLDDQLPVDAETTFRIGSITKQFTAASIMMLVQAGKLKLDDTLATYLPDAPHANDVTLRELLTHTSGIPGYTELESFDAASKLPATPEQIVATIAHEPLAFSPGTDWEYSNTNYILLGMVVEKVSGEPYEQFVTEHIIDPLHLDDTSFWNPLLVSHDAGVGYSTVPFEPVLHATDWNWDWAWAAGGLNTNAGDLARWDSALDSGTVVTPESFTEMSTAQRLKNGTSTHYGFGLGVSTFLKRKIVVHTGGVPGFITENLTVPQDGVAVVVFGNSDSFQPGPVTSSIVNALYAVTPPKPKTKTLAVKPAVKAEAQHDLETFLAGRFAALPLRADFARYLRGVIGDEDVDLGRKLGALHGIALVATDRRPPLVTYYYRADFGRGAMLYTLALDRNGTIAGIGIQRWL